MMSVVPAALSVNDAAHYIGVSRATIYVLIKTGKLARVKLGHRTLIRRSNLDALLEAPK